MGSDYTLAGNIQMTARWGEEPWSPTSGVQKTPETRPVTSQTNNLHKHTRAGSSGWPGIYVSISCHSFITYFPAQSS